MVVGKSLDFSGFGQVGTGASFLPNANINVAHFAKNYVALTEVPAPVIFDVDSLNTLGAFAYNDTLPKSHIWECAHPHHDPATGQIISYMVQYFPKSQYVIYTMDKGSNQRNVLAEIPVEAPAYMHSFALTKKHVILVEFPLFINPHDLNKGGSFSSHFKWMPEKKMRIIAVSRDTGDIAAVYTAEPVFAWHHINSFEDKGTLYIDMAAYENAGTFLENSSEKQIGRFVRYRVNQETREVIKEDVGPSIEMPRIAYARNNGLRYSYVYGYDDSHSMKELKTRPLVKIDTTTKFSTQWREELCIADEPIFVARPGGSSEDDGVLLANVLDLEKGKSFLLILDAKNMTELARAELMHHIPYTLHGDFIQK
jgi:carotenoid cleavage dioxygenase-like enzyme